MGSGGGEKSLTSKPLFQVILKVFSLSGFPLSLLSHESFKDISNTFASVCWLPWLSVSFLLAPLRVHAVATASVFSLLGFIGTGWRLFYAWNRAIH